MPGTTTGLGATCTVGRLVLVHGALAKHTKMQNLPTHFEGAADQVLHVDHPNLANFNPEAYVATLSEVLDPEAGQNHLEVVKLDERKGA